MSETTQPTTCHFHPSLETALRCNQCEKYICPKCAKRTPTGYRCPECLSGQQKKFETAEPIDYILGTTITAVLSGIASFIISLIGSIGFFGFFLVLMAAPTAGVAIADIAQRTTSRRRAKYLFIAIAAAVVIGALPMLIFQLLIFNPFGLLFQGIYLFMVTPTVYSRLSGLQLFK
jgi:hypothetical protein